MMGIFTCMKHVFLLLFALASVTLSAGVTKHNVTVYVNDGTMGLATGAGQYNHGDTATLTAIPAYCHYFMGWSDGKTDNPRKVVVNSNLSFIAVFDTISASITTSSDNAKGGMTYCRLDGVDAPSMHVGCGSVVEIHAKAFSYYHFTSWSDGNTDSVRYIEVTSDTSFTAHFETNCDENADWPAELLYNRLIILDVNDINALGFYPKESDVAWYKVIGSVDPITEFFPEDDYFICNGYYLSIDRYYLDYGKYYATVDVTGRVPSNCSNFKRTVIVNYNPGYSSIRVAPSSANGGELLTLDGLNPDEESTITILNSSGQPLSFFRSSGASLCSFVAPASTGIYLVRVTSDSVNETAKFIVTNTETK